MGQAITVQEARKRTSRYMMQVHSRLVLDAAETLYDDNHGKFINDGPVSGRRANVRYGASRRTSTCPVTGRRWISVIATHDIKKGQEILADYGPAYIWEPHRVDGYVQARKGQCMNGAPSTASKPCGTQQDEVGKEAPTEKGVPQTRNTTCVDT